MLEVHHTFMRVLPKNSLEDWCPLMYGDHVAIDMTNRYFTDRHDQPPTDTINFKSCVDPDGILDRLMGDDYIHTSENEVEYYEAFVGENGLVR